MSMCMDLTEYNGEMAGLKWALDILESSSNLEEAKAKLKEATQLSFEDCFPEYGVDMDDHHSEEYEDGDFDSEDDLEDNDCPDGQNGFDQNRQKI
jgi:hypothetical protein